MPRRFIRHPTGIPIQISIPNCNADLPEHRSNCDAHRVQTNDISVGGLSCESPEIMNAGQAVEVEIWLNNPSFKTIDLSSEAAAEEWIGKYAADFPSYPC